MSFSEFISRLGWIDIAAAAGLCWALYRGYYNGVENEFPKIIEVILTTLIAVALSPIIGDVVSVGEGNFGTMFELSVFIILSGGSLFFLRALSLSLKSPKSINLPGFISKPLGMLSTVVKDTFLLGLIVHMLLLFPGNDVVKGLSATRSYTGTIFRDLSQEVCVFVYGFTPFPYRERGKAADPDNTWYEDSRTKSTGSKGK